MSKIPDEIGQNAKLLFVLFLREYKSEEGGFLYQDKAEEVKKEELSTLYVDFQHVKGYDSNLGDVVGSLYYRVYPFLCEGVTQFINSQSEGSDESKSYFVAFYNHDISAGLREMTTEKIGKLINISGTVTRSSAVRPELIQGAFTCLDCRQEIPNIQQQFVYAEPQMCLNPICENHDKWSLQLAKSTFVDWQMLRVQENPSEIPAGSMPRNMRIIVRNETVERAKPGDKCTFTGTLIVLPDVAQLGRGGSVSMRKKTVARDGITGVTGLKSLGARDLTYRMCFLACDVKSQITPNQNLPQEEDEEHFDNFTVAEKETIIRMRQTPKLYQNMVKSVAPTIFGHEEIKRGILLQLFGGVQKTTPSSARLRGDINVCIVGDPSTSKSQFLKYVCSFVPRAVYTSGKASSAAGLTASVGRDPDTGEFAIEAGALMLADHGICCIDEFDKMDVVDQVAIHEAMEQQTISITKAGIQATLNARTAILAAANPIKGRYDESRTLKQNVDISPPIMSRFDLFFVVLDQCIDYLDFHIAQHIVQVHQKKPQALASEFSTEELQLYIRFAKTLRPKLSQDARNKLMNYYIALRGNDAGGAQNAAYRITVRQLESMIRLSEARARVDLQEIVAPKHVEEAYRLLSKSIVRVDSELALDDDDEINSADEDAEGEGSDYDPNDEGDDDDDMQGGGGGEAQGDQKQQPPAEGSDNEEVKAAPVAKRQPKLKISFQEYQRLSNLLVWKLRHEQEQADLHGREDVGMRQGDLVSWWVDTQQDEGEVDNLASNLLNTRKCLSIVRRLIGVDRVLLVVTNSAEEEDRVLTVHPNYSIEDSATNQLRISQAQKIRASAPTAGASGLESKEEQEQPEETPETPTPQTPSSPVKVRSARKSRSRATTPASTRKRKTTAPNTPVSPTPSTQEEPEEESTSVRLKRRKR